MIALPSWAEELVSEVKNRKSHFFIIYGNVYDRVVLNGFSFPDTVQFLLALTEKKIPQCLLYDIFLGIQLKRGDKEKIFSEMGIVTPKSNDPNAGLISALKQIKGASNPTNLPVNPLEALPVIDKLFEKTNESTALIVDHADVIFPASLQGTNRQIEKVPSIALSQWSRNRSIRQKGHLIFVVARHIVDIDPLLLDRSFEAVKIRVPKPSQEERQKLILKKFGNSHGTSSINNAMAGLSFKDIDRLVDLKTTDGATNHRSIDEIFKFKQKILREEYADLIEVMETQRGFEAIGGLEKVITKLNKIALNIRNGHTTLVPQGILFSGPPGTGKTIVAEAFAKEAGVNFVKPMDIQTMWLGESEKRMTKFMDAIKDLTPVVVFIDEFDQNQSSRGAFEGDSGVGRRLFKKMLEIMSDTSLRGKILWIFATNRPDLIDSAIKRPGRCDLIIPFLPPDKHQLALICRAAFKQYPEMKSGIKNWNLYASRCEGYSGAQIIEVIRRAWERANDMGRKSVEDKDMIWAYNDYQPQIQQNSDIERMTLLSLMECSSRDLRPDNWKRVVKDLFPRESAKIVRLLEKGGRDKRAYQAIRTLIEQRGQN